MLLNAARWRERRALPRLLLLLLVACSISWLGCSPDAFLPVDVERDRDVQRARDALKVNDFEGAAEYFERALERHPRSAMIHLAYGSLCETKLGRYADAVYHYQRFLKFTRPNDSRADDIRARVKYCTERLATSVPLVVRSETIARDLEIARRENIALTARLADAAKQIAFWSNEVVRVTADLRASQSFTASQNDARDARAVEPRVPTATESSRPRSSNRTATENPTGASTSQSLQNPQNALTHRIRPGDTLHRISRQYGVSVEALRRANPGVNERRLLPGTVLRIPPR
jgi:LysM repeat protein